MSLYNTMLKVTFHGKVVAKNEGQYKHIVFQNLEKNIDPFLQYITTCVCPNWTGYIPVTGDVGFVTCQFVNAGDVFIKPDLSQECYSYDNCYFLSFVKNETIEDKQKEFNF